MASDDIKTAIKTSHKLKQFIQRHFMVLAVSAAILIPGSWVVGIDDRHWNGTDLGVQPIAETLETDLGLHQPDNFGESFTSSPAPALALATASDTHSSTTPSEVKWPVDSTDTPESPPLSAEPIQLAAVSDHGVSAIIDDSTVFTDPPIIRWSETVVRRNDTLGRVFKRNKVDVKIAYRLVKIKDAKLIHRIYPGDRINFAQNESGKLIGIELRRGKNKVLMVHLADGDIEIVSPDEAKRVGTLHAYLNRVYETQEPDRKIEEMIPKLPDLSQMDLVWHAETVRRGDTLSHIFRRVGLSQTEAITVAGAPSGSWLSSGLKPGQKIRIATSAEGKFVALELPNINSTTVRTVILHENDYLTGTREMESEVQEHHACVKIKSNVYSAAKGVSMSSLVVDEYTELFGSRIDFNRQLQRGDEMCVIYEQTYVKGRAVRSPQIVAASLRQKNAYIQAYRVKYHTGRVEYYDQDGIALKGHFLRSPIKSGRVTSVFTSNRFHPILKVNRKHLGVDYGARTGTPIRATSNGYVIKRQYDSGYGKFIVLRHGSKYETLYAHLSRYAKGSGVGNYVEQGQVIGYVGSTGLSTGPHLHYEFRVNGVHRDPLSYPMPKGEQIAESAREAFDKVVNILSARLASIEKPMLVYIPAEPAEELAKE